MALLKGVAFAAGGVGLVLFLGGVVWALLVQPPCPTGTCAQGSWDTNRLTTNIMFLWIGGLILEATAVVFLVLHLRDLRKSPGGPRRGPATSAAGRQQARPPQPPRQNAMAPTVSVTRRPPTR